MKEGYVSVDVRLAATGTWPTNRPHHLDHRHANPFIWPTCALHLPVPPHPSLPGPPAPRRGPLP